MKDLFRYFFKLGTTGFGGPIAMIGMMERHFVQKEALLTYHRYQQMVAAAKLFPGPLATLVAIRIGHELKGIRGGIIAGVCLIAPAFFMILAISHLMVDAKSQSNAIFSQIFSGLNLGGLALSVVAAIHFAKPLLSVQSAFYLIPTAVLTYYYPQEEIFFLLASGILSLLYHRFRNHLFEFSSVLVGTLFFESLKASLFTYGSGIAIVPVLKAVYIDRYHWVSSSDFLTALTFGQITPGPLVIFHTYLAHQIASVPGAFAATFGTFLPAFIFGIWAMPLFEKKLLKSPTLNIFFSGMLPAVAGAIIGSVLRLCHYAIQDSEGKLSSDHVLLLIVLSIVALRSKVHPIFIIFLGATLLLVSSYFTG